MHANMRYQKLKEILFEEERKEQKRLQDQISTVDEKIEKREKLEPHIQPILDDKVTYLQKNFSFLFGREVTHSIKRQIRESQDEVVEALYPILGKMVKKYIIREIELLSERIDEQLDRAFSWQGWVARVKAWFGGVQEKDMVVSRLIHPQLQQVFVIEQHSGLLLGSYSRAKALDEDMISGMLTAIRQFVKDAFDEGSEELETIEYETFKIMIRNFKSFYVVAAISGGLTLAYRDHLEDVINDFASQFASGSFREHGKIKKLLERHFKS